MALVNEGADSAYTVSCENDNVTLTEGWNGEYYFTATAAGTYEVLLTSVANPEMTATLTIVVTEAPAPGEGDGEVTEGLVGTWTNIFTHPMNGFEFVNTPNSVYR